MSETYKRKFTNYIYNWYSGTKIYDVNDYIYRFILFCTNIYIKYIYIIISNCFWLLASYNFKYNIYTILYLNLSDNLFNKIS